MAVKFYLEKRLNKQGEAPIRCSIAIKGKRIITTTGYSIAPDCWDSNKQKVISTFKSKPVENSKGVKAMVINTHLKQIDSYFAELESNALNSKDEFGDLKEIYTTKFGKIETVVPQKIEKNFYTYYDEFTEEMGKRNDWTPATYEKFHALKAHIEDYSDKVSFETFNDTGLTNFVEFLRNQLNLRNSTIGKQLGFLKWFLKWAHAKGYNQETAYQSFSPKLKATEKKVVFFEWDELMKIYKFKFPKLGTKLKLKDVNGKKYEKKTVLEKETLEHVRDVFCFCCFTSLRYSDVANLTKANVFDDHIMITTIKTTE